MVDAVERLLRYHDHHPEFLEDSIVSPFVRQKVRDQLLTIDDHLLSEVGPWRLLRVIGEGGFARVYLAEQTTPIRRRVAIKVIRLGVDTQHVLRRFELERQTLAALKHPGIATLHEAGTIDDGSGRPYFVMEHIDGLPINAYCREKNLPLRERLRLLTLVCDAVQYAHAKGVIHRDLKPSNVLVQCEAGEAIPKIIDFGVAKALLDGAAPEHTFATREGELIGTLAYMSPEQVNGRADVRSDVYAIGVMAYELVSGELPIEVRGLPLLDALQRLRDTEPLRVSKHRPELRGDLEIILSRALTKQPDERYASADALGTDFARFLRSEPILARDNTVAYVAWTLGRKHRATLALGLICGTIGLGGGLFGVSAYIQGRVDHSRRVASAESRTRIHIATLEAQSGTLRVRESMAAEALDDTRDLLASDSSNPAMLTLRADALRQASNIAVEKGEFAEAMQYRQEALAHRQRAASVSPDDDSILSRLVTDLVVVADMHVRLSDVQVAQSWYDRSHRVAQQLMQRSPSDEHASVLAWSHQRLAARAFARADMNEATQQAQAALDLIAGILRNRPQDTDAMDCARICHGLRGSVAGNTGRPEDARQEFERALRYATAMFSAEPGMRRYAVGYLHALMAALDHSEAEDSDPIARRADIRDGFDVAKRLVELDPHERDALLFAANFSVRLATLAAQDRDHEEVQRRLTDAIDWFARIPGDDAVRQWGIGGTYWDGSLLFSGMGRADLADEWLDRALAQFREVCARSDATPIHLRGLAQLLVDPRLGERRDHEQALVLATTAFQRETPPSTEALCALGRVHTARGEHDTALQCFRKAAEMNTDSSFAHVIATEMARAAAGLEQSP